MYVLQAEAYGCVKGLHRCIEWNYSSTGGASKQAMQQQQIPAWLQQAIDLLTFTVEEIESTPSLANTADKEALTANTFWHVSTQCCSHVARCISLLVVEMRLQQTCNLSQIYTACTCVLYYRKCSYRYHQRSHQQMQSIEQACYSRYTSRAPVHSLLARLRSKMTSTAQCTQLQKQSCFFLSLTIVGVLSLALVC
jgi:hypothetical protein